MASLTESYLLYNNEERPNPNEPNKNWFEAVYLCIENYDIKQNNIKGVSCYKFDTVEKATKYYDVKKISNPIFQNIKYDILPICKFVPFIMHKPIIKYKLNTTSYNIKQITIFRTIQK
jgi:hypothetical protein